MKEYKRLGADDSLSRIVQPPVKEEVLRKSNGEPDKVIESVEIPKPEVKQNNEEQKIIQVPQPLELPNKDQNFTANLQVSKEKEEKKQFLLGDKPLILEEKKEISQIIPGARQQIEEEKKGQSKIIETKKTVEMEEDLTCIITE